MSSQRQKIKHSQRMLRKKAAVRKQVQIAREHGAPVKQPHRLHKKHAMDCGQPHCMLCGNPRKLWKERTKQEDSFDQPRLWQD